MNAIYTKIMGFLFGEAIANSDRIKIAVAGFVTGLIVNLTKGCSFCQTILTPEVVDLINKGIAGLVVTLIAALSKRDIAAPGQTIDPVTGAAPVPVAPKA